MIIPNTMKTVNINIDEETLVVLWRIFNQLGATPQRDEFKKTKVYKDGIEGSGYTNLAAEFEAVAYSKLWNVLNNAAKTNDIDVRYFNIEPPIMAAGHEVKFENGQIKVGCTTISNEVVKQIAAKLK